jgi:predicted nucleic acid-binding protein
MSDIPRLYLDAAPIIDLVKVRVGLLPTGNAETDVWTLDRLFAAAREGEIQLFTSTLTVAECTHVSDRAKLDQAKPFFLGLLASGKGGVAFVQPSFSIAERARNLRWVHDFNFSGADAIHAASALHMNCHEIITSDGRIMKASAILQPLGMRACRSADTAYLPSKYRQENFKL